MTPGYMIEEIIIMLLNTFIGGLFTGVSIMRLRG